MGPADMASLEVDRESPGNRAFPAGRGEAAEPVWEAPVVWAGAVGADGVDGIPAGGCADRCRRPGECSGYT